ncbi:hypothetical protein KUV57_13495 [Epibacterium sp. DP7N7-1]|nr:hypothetical protein [Epibacterium sp. DP7N7-1]
MLRTALAALIFTVGAAGITHAEGMRFHEAIAHHGVRAQVDELLGEQPAWVAFVLDRGGVEGKPITLTLEDQDYEFYPTCRPHECEMKKIGLLIGDDGSTYVRLYGAQTEDQIFGDPPAKVAEALAAQE